MASSSIPTAKAKRRLPLFSTVGKKVIMAVSGLALCGFLCGHLAGNLLLLQGGRFTWFNTYARTLNALPFLLLLELGIVAMFLIHAYDGFVLHKQNKEARGQGEYYYKEWTRQRKSSKSRKGVSSTTMFVTGVTLLLFTALHIWHFKYHHSIGPENPISAQIAGKGAPLVGVGTGGIAPAEGQSVNESKAETSDLAAHVVYELKKPYVLVLYVLCMIALASHLNHAVSSAFQSLGASNTRFERPIIWFGKLFTVAIGGAFILLPIWVSFFSRLPR